MNYYKEIMEGSFFVYLEKYSDYEVFIKFCFSLLFIVCCNSSIELLVIVLLYENLLVVKFEVGVFMIDSLSVFYWFDRSVGGESLGY